MNLAFSLCVDAYFLPNSFSDVDDSFFHGICKTLIRDRLYTPFILLPVFFGCYIYLTSLRILTLLHSILSDCRFQFHGIEICFIFLFFFIIFKSSKWVRNVLIRWNSNDLNQYSSPIKAYFLNSHYFESLLIYLIYFIDDSISFRKFFN